MNKKLHITIAVMLVLAGILSTSCAWAADYTVRSANNIPYIEGENPPNPLHSLDIYYPAGEKACPVVIFIHGGAWAKGDKGAHTNLGMNFAKKRFVTVVINYRLSPQVKHPAHIQDCAAAFAWVYKNISKYGGEPSMIFVMGHSAGGHLATLLALDPQYLKAYKLTPENICGVIGVSGLYHLDGLKNYPFFRKMMSDAFGIDATVLKKASPSTYVRSGLPTTLLVFADKDNLITQQQSRIFYAKLKKAENPVKIRQFKDRNHRTIISSIGAKGDPVLPAIMDFISFRCYD